MSSPTAEEAAAEQSAQQRAERAQEGRRRQLARRAAALRRELGAEPAPGPTAEPGAGRRSGRGAGQRPGGRAGGRAGQDAGTGAAETPLARLLREQPVDWSSPRRQATTAPTPRLLADAARRKRVGRHTVHRAYRSLTHDGQVIGGTVMALHSLVSDQAQRIARNPDQTAAMLAHRGVAAAETRIFSPDEPDGPEQVRAALAELGGPGVLKPDFSRAGTGVSTGLGAGADVDGDLAAAWEWALESRVDMLHVSRGIVLQPEHEGLDLQVWVVGEEVVSALVRLPAVVVGDGAADLRTLAAGAVEARSSHALLAASPPPADDEDLRMLGLDPDHVPAAGERLPISGTTHPSAGGLTLEVTDQLTAPLRDLAVEAVWAIPGLTAAAVDLRAPRLDDAEGALVVDVSPDADPRPHHFPAFGRPRRVADALIGRMIARAG